MLLHAVTQREPAAAIGVGELRGRRLRQRGFAEWLRNTEGDLKLYPEGSGEGRKLPNGRISATGLNP